MAGLVWWLIGVRASACDEDLEALGATLDAAERSVAELDSARFETSMERVREVLGCLREPVTPAIAARLHRAVGVRAFAARGPLAAGAFAAARRIEADWPLSETLFPAESPVREAWSAISLDSPRIRVLPDPTTGWLVLDGTRGVERAVDLPVVFQRVEADGSVTSSAYLLPGEPTPLYPTGAPPSTRSDHRAPFAVTAVASGVAAAGLWGLSVHGRDRFLDLGDPVPDHRLDGLQTRTNALTVSSAVSAGLCVASSALLVATW